MLSTACGTHAGDLASRKGHTEGRIFGGMCTNLCFVLVPVLLPCTLHAASGWPRATARLNATNTRLSAWKLLRRFYTRSAVQLLACAAPDVGFRRG